MTARSAVTAFLVRAAFKARMDPGIYCFRLASVRSQRATGGTPTRGPWQSFLSEKVIKK